MLVLSRKQGEAVEFAELDVVVRVVSLKKSKVQLGIEAPRQITVCRSEIAGEKRFPQTVDTNRVENELDVGIMDELSTIEAQVAALAELADAQDAALARDLAADSIQRIARIKTSVRRAMRGQTVERPIADFIKVRADVIDQLRVTSTDSEICDGQDREQPNNRPSVAWPSAKTHRTSCVQERQPGYMVNSASAVREFGLA